MKRILPAWNPEDVRRLRLHCGMTQQQLADELAIRQATISEWECAKKRPQRTNRHALMLLAQRAAFPLEKESNG